MQINIERSGLRNLMDLINQKSNVALTDAEVELSAPQTWEDPEGVNPRNALAVMTAKEGSGFTGTYDIRYTRLTLDGIRDGVEVGYEMSAESTLQSIRAAASTVLGVVEEDVELSITEMPVVEAPMTIQVVAKSSSYLYIGQTDVTIYPIPEVDEELETTMQTNDMDGFDYPAAG